MMKDPQGSSEGSGRLLCDTDPAAGAQTIDDSDGLTCLDHLREGISPNRLCLDVDTCPAYVPDTHADRSAQGFVVIDARTGVRLKAAFCSGGFCARYPSVRDAVCDETHRECDDVRRLAEKLHREIVYLREEVQAEHNFEEMIGASASMQKVFHRIARIAPLEQPVLIQGATGTGKELVAMAIHRRSLRAAEPIVKINCAAVPEGLLESELFGHEKGAFTGAIHRTIGRFELANGGTVFLDEIGDMSPALQAKLLRALEQKEFERVGGTQTLKVDIRFIAATNCNLEEAVERGTFRKDLYYRLNVLPIHLPSLAERAEDIPLLLAYFVDRSNRAFHKGITKVAKASMDAILKYHWPGNVRELKNLIESGVVLSDSDCLEIALVIREEQGDRQGTPSDREAKLLHGDYQRSVEACKKRIIYEAILRAGGSKKDAARLLGMAPSYLSQLSKRLNIG